MLKPAQVVRYVSAALVALTLAFAAPTPARADANIDACFNSLADVVKTAADVAKNLGLYTAHPECLAWTADIPTDALFLAVTGIVTAADAAGVFNGTDYNACFNATNTVLVSAITAALASSTVRNRFHMSPSPALVSRLEASALHCRLDCNLSFSAATPTAPTTTFSPMT